MPFITWTFLNTWSDVGGFSAAAGACAFRMPTPRSAANSAAATTVVPIDPRFMRSPSEVLPTNDKGRMSAALMIEKLRALLRGFSRRRLAEVRRAVDLLAAVGFGDLR